MSEQTKHCCSGTSDLENMPMTRYANPLPNCEEEEPACSDCECARELEVIITLLTCQNQLLVDLLGAVNSLTAACLNRHRT